MTALPAQSAAALFMRDEFTSRCVETAKDCMTLRAALNALRNEWPRDKRDEPAFNSVEYAMNDLETLAERLRQTAEEV